MKIVIGSDHAGFKLKEILIDYLQENGFQIIDLGTYSDESVDYPVYGEKVARSVVNHQTDLGIAICGTGIGIGIAANKVPGCRAVICSEPYSAKMSRQHNDANVLAIGSRVVGVEAAKMIVDTWLKTEFLGGRHAQRIDMIRKIEIKKGC
ncbi:ribose 5-phosphate isomerase B [Sporolactobacillus putidus]|uniref:Ribose 5-phosphate isomerase B n=1 Tax=Sporolactobacillus putidus TaxID=492735 RepID=A0A917W363_9BACL|nr:ribose 5-phosphate isomerase B [Sporolactobacillus putidus]GGL56889.1 ribose 5-phosphate isomerase B [Sporolactobacillus putidus]